MQGEKIKEKEKYGEGRSFNSLIPSLNLLRVLGEMQRYANHSLCKLVDYRNTSNLIIEIPSEHIVLH